MRRTMIREMAGAPVAGDWQANRNWCLILDTLTGTLYRLVDGQPAAIGGGEAGPHEHAVSDVTGLEALLDAKAAGDHNHDDAYAPAEHSHDYAATSHGHAISDTSGLQAALDGKAASGHNHDGTYATAAHNHDADYEPKNANLQAHVAAAHAPSNAQKNSDITKAEIEAKLTGEISSHTHAGGSDAWTYLRLASDFTTTSATAVDITGLGFAPSANQRYEFEGQLFLRTATASVNPRAGLAWPTGMTDGVANIDEAQSATAILMSRGNISAALLVAVGGLPNTTQSWPATVWGSATAGASPSGNIRLQLASETAGTVVTSKAGSWLKYRTIP